MDPDMVLADEKWAEALRRIGEETAVAG